MSTNSNAKMKLILKDKFNRQYRVYHGTLENAPCYGMHLIAWGEMVEKGWAMPWQGWQTASKVVCPLDPESGKPVGYICYQDGDGGGVWLTMTYVAPSYRGRGLHKSMYNLFEQLQVERNRTGISSLVHVNNTVAIKNIQETGRELLYYKAHKVLPGGGQ